MQTDKLFISVVIPLYNCEVFVSELSKRLINTLGKINSSFEIIFVNDASPQNDWNEVIMQSKIDSRIKGLNFSRNFGQHYAISAGLNYAKGEWIVVMDGDLQDQPEEIINLYDQTKKGYDIVFGKRFKRKDKFFKKLRSKIFYTIYNFFTDSKFDHSIANFSISNKKVIKEFNSIKESDRSFPLIIQWLGFKIGHVNIKHENRKEGKSSYNLKKLFHFAASSIISQSNKPLKISIFLGFFFAFISFILAIWMTYRKIILDIPVIGWSSLIVSLFFLGGLILANIGIVGLYIGRIFNETKERPLYIIKNKIGL